MPARRGCAVSACFARVELPVTFTAAALLAALEAHVPVRATGLVVGVSGGRDSACLLVAIAQLRRRGLSELPLRAVHVDHGLQPAAPEFRAACARACARYGVAFTVLTVSVDTAGGESVEAAARDARYAGFARDLQVGECLLTAHHADDQAETVLLQWLRGAGVKGAAAMPACRSLGPGFHVRPLLEVSRRELEQFAAAEGVVACSDPMNVDVRFDRAYLRAQVWPVLLRRWPGAATALSRAGRHAAEAQGFLDRAGAATLARLQDGEALCVTGLRALPRAEQLNVLRFWIARRGVVLPPVARLNEGLRQILDAAADRQPMLRWGGHALRRHRERLYLTAAALPTVLSGEWCIGTAGRGIAQGGQGREAGQAEQGASLGAQPSIELGAGLGRLRWTSQRGGLDVARLPDTLTVRGRRGGETLKVARGARTRTLQHLCQEWGVVPWMRDALPLVYAGGALIAVGDLWLDARWCVAVEAPGFGCAWDDAPGIV